MNKPLFIMALLDAPVRAHKFSDSAWLKFFKNAHKVKVDYLRVFPFWGGHKEGRTEMYLREPCGHFNLDKPNPDYDYQLGRLNRLARRYGLRLLYDFFDNCSCHIDARHNNPWYNNRNGVNGMYDYTPKAIGYFKRHIDRIYGVLGLGGTMYSLGNELRFPQENNVQARKKWAMGWAKPLAEHIKALPYERPIYFSASDITGHKIMGYCSPEDGSTIGYNGLVNQIHGISTAEFYKERWEGKLTSAATRVYAYSDDGVGCNPESVVPVGMRGRCSRKKHDPRYIFCCSGNNAVRIAAVMAMWEDIGDRLHSVEFLPREIAEDEKIGHISPKFSLDVYKYLADEFKRKGVV